jgi:hypothetical protein
MRNARVKRRSEVKAYLLIKTSDGSASVGAAVRSMPGIDTTDEVSGALDVVAVATVDSISDLFDTVLPRIRELPGVIHVLPAPLVPAPLTVSVPPAGEVVAA